MINYQSLCTRNVQTTAAKKRAGECFESLRNKVAVLINCPPDCVNININDIKLFEGKVIVNGFIKIDIKNVNDQVEATITTEEIALMFEMNKGHEIVTLGTGPSCVDINDGAGLDIFLDNIVSNTAKESFIKTGY